MHSDQLTLGEKIKQLRCALGLSQRQLAGKEMTRAFISLVESGRSAPGPETLRVIASRLGKPADYFLGPLSGEVDVKATVVLLESAQENVRERKVGWAGSAREKLTLVLQGLSGLDRPDLEGEARLLLVQVFTTDGLYDKAVEEAERASACFKKADDRPGIARVVREEGTLAFLREDFPTARQKFEQAALLSYGLKTMLEFRSHVMQDLAATWFCLGKYDEAISCYLEAIKTSSNLNAPALRGAAALGLGGAYYRQGNLQKALVWAQTAVKWLEQCNDPSVLQARHNLGVIAAAKGNWERAYGVFSECRRTFQARGMPYEQATVMEEIARYWIHRQRPDRAEATCWEALDVLGARDESLLRGRLYRLIGQIQARQGRFVEARNMLRVSLTLLRRVRAEEEVSTTLEEMLKINEGGLTGDREGSTDS